MANRNKLSLVQLAARLYGCPVEELLSYREYEDGSVVIIAPSGQKFAYSAESIKQVMLAEESPQATLSVAAPLEKAGEESPPTPLDKGGAEAQEGPEGPEEQEVPEAAEVPKVSKVSKVAKVAEVAEVAKVVEVVNEHAGTAKRSR